jgi:hypothetical protein
MATIKIIEFCYLDYFEFGYSGKTSRSMFLIVGTWYCESPSVNQYPYVIYII